MLVILAASLLPGAFAHADSLTEDSAKAGFIFNFTKYTEWPSGSGDLKLCSVSEDALSGKLESLQGYTVQGRTIRVLFPTDPKEWRQCQVLFIAADDAQRVGTVLRSVARYPVLTISDAANFSQAGGIIGLKLRNGRIRFDINHGAAHQAGLKLSSQLLKLADEVLQ